MGDLDYISYHGLLEIITEMVCSCESDTTEVISAINDLSEMDLSECERIIDALAIETYSWDKCFRELGGLPYAIFVRMINFKNQINSVFPGIIREFDFITSHEKGLKMPRVKDWTVFERLFIRAAVASARSGNSDYGSRSGSEGRSPGKNSSHSSDDLSAHMAHTDLKYTGVPKGRNGKDLYPVFGGKMYRKTGDAEADKATTDMAREMGNLCKELDELEKNGKDIDLKCNKCGKNFIHSVPDQVRFKTRKWTNLPGKCSECRDEGPCFDFHKTGECKYGDKCRFDHYGNLSSSDESDTSEDDNSDSDSIDLDCY